MSNKQNDNYFETKKEYFDEKIPYTHKMKGTVNGKTITGEVNIKYNPTNSIVGVGRAPKIAREEIINCPICKGTGKIEFGKLQSKKKEWVMIKKKMCKTLVKNGFTYRQVAKLLGFKSPASVVFIINGKK